MLSEKFYFDVPFLPHQKYLLGGDCRHSLTLQACKFLITACSHCSTQRGARKTLWQYAASKRMHFFIHRFIYVHISLRAGIIQIYQIQEMGHKSGFVPLFRDLSDIWYFINLFSSSYIFIKAPCICRHRAKPLTASIHRASIRRGGEDINSTSKGFFFDEIFLLAHPKNLNCIVFHP